MKTKRCTPSSVLRKVLDQVELIELQQYRITFWAANFNGPHSAGTELIMCGIFYHNILSLGGSNLMLAKVAETQYLICSR